MSQLVFKFPFKTKYFEQDFYVSSNNFSAYKLIESWPSWPGKWLNIFGTSGSGKTHLSKILEKKIDNIKLIDAKNLNNKVINDLNNLDCLIIDNFNNNVEEKLLTKAANSDNKFKRWQRKKGWFVQFLVYALCMILMSAFVTWITGDGNIHFFLIG